MSVLQLDRHLDSPTNGNGKHPPGTARRRRRPPAVAVGLAVALVALGVFVFLTPRTTRPVSVLVLRSSVPAGQAITTGDLKVVSLSLPRGMAIVPASQEVAVVGQVALTNLSPGTLLAPSAYGTTEGQWSEVGVSVRPGQYPPGLTAGEVVEAVVGPPSAGGTPTPLPAGTVLAPTAHVVSVTSGTGSPGSAMVALDVPPAEALALAEIGAADQVLLVVVQR